MITPDERTLSPGLLPAPRTAESDTRPGRPVLTTRSEIPDLAPMIHRQRLVVEGRMPRPIDAEEIKRYLVELGAVTDMVVLTEPVTHRSPLYGWAGWIHWETSGAHFYAWEQPVLFFSVDVYTCKAFDPEKVARFTAEFFSATDIVAREF